MQFESDGVYLWQACRMAIYYRLSQSCGVLEQPHQASLKTPPLTKIIKLLRTLVKVIKHRPSFPANATPSTLVVEHPRKVFWNGRFQDVYSLEIREQLSDLPCSWFSLDPGLEHHPEYQNNEIKLPPYWIQTKADLLGKLHFRLPSNTRLQLQTLSAVINKNFNTDIISTNYLETQLLRFKSLENSYLNLMRRLNITTLYLTTSYDNAALVSAGRRQNCKIIEVQHGTFSRFHLGYSFPDTSHAPKYLPDIFLCWSSQWENRFRSINVFCNAQAHSFGYLAAQINAYKGTITSPFKLVVISQGVVGERLANLILENIDKLTGLEINYKLHPGEYSRWRQYPSLVKLAQQNRVKIIENCNLHALLASAQVTIGVFSTALYEAFELGSKVVIADLPGHEYMEEMISDGHATAFFDWINSLPSSRSSQSTLP